MKKEEKTNVMRLHDGKKVSYETEIKRVSGLIKISRELGRGEWTEKNQKYLEMLEAVRDKILQKGLVHQNGRHREG